MLHTFSLQLPVALRLRLAIALVTILIGCAWLALFVLLVHWLAG